MTKQSGKKKPKGLSPAAKKELTAQEKAARKARVYRLGAIVVVILIVLTILEYLTSVLSNSPIILILFAITIGGIILAYYMHLGDMFD